MLLLIDFPCYSPCAEQIAKQRLEIEALKKATLKEWPHYDTSTWFKVQEGTRLKMGQSLEIILNSLDATSGVFRGVHCISVQLKSPFAEKQCIAIDFTRNPETTQLVKGDVRLIDPTSAIVDEDGNEYTAAAWSQKMTTQALIIKDRCLISDRQYHELRKFFKMIIKAMCGRAFLVTICKFPATLGSVKKLQASVNLEAETKLGLKAVMGPPTLGPLTQEMASRDSSGDSYMLSRDIIGAEFDLRLLIHYALTIYWIVLQALVVAGTVIFFRFTIDGARLTDSKNFVTASM